MKHLQTFIFLISTLIIVSCNPINIPTNVEEAINKAGTNSIELEKVIKHYSQRDEDSLKLKATYFLISNMEGHSYYQTKIVDSSNHLVDFQVLKYPNYKTMVAAWDSVEREIGPIDFTKDTIVYDLESITFEFLTENIDLAFESWEKPWAKFLSFNEFCNYILPYRSSGEPLDFWRRAFSKRYAWVQDSIKDDKSTLEAAYWINNEIKSWFKFDPLFYRHPTDLSYHQMLDYKRGRCEDMTNLAIFAMRSQGIPVVSDYTPAWPNTGNNHAWNAIITKERKVIIFMGGESNPGEYELNNKKAKVYRKMFASQENSLAKIKPTYEKVPGWLRRSTYIDVTKDYIPVISPDIELLYSKPDSVNFAYLAVFNSGEWKAIHWGRIQNKNATFTDMGGDIVYLPTYYRNKKLLPANEAFILEMDGTIRYLKADTLHKTKIKLYSTTKRAIVKTTDEIRIASFKPNKTYELFYWEKRWIKIGEQVAVKDKALEFEVPKNALLWLVEKDSKKEERIFTIDENLNLHWW